MTKKEKEQRIELVNVIIMAIEEQYEAHNNDIIDRYDKGCLYGLLLAKSAAHDVLRAVIDSEVQDG